MNAEMGPNNKSLDLVPMYKPMKTLSGEKEKNHIVKNPSPKARDAIHEKKQELLKREWRTKKPPIKSP